MLDEILSALDRDPPGYRELYYEWERNQWESTAIDLAEDRAAWERLDDDARGPLLSGFATLYVAAWRATEDLVPFVDAVQVEEQQVFLSTELADEARHTVFMDAVFTQVVQIGEEEMEQRIVAQRDRCPPQPRSLILERIPAAAESLRRDPAGQDVLIAGLTLRHVELKEAICLPLYREVIPALDAKGLARAAEGLTLMARDDVRHVLFGRRFLREVSGSIA
jgi:ribonucleoside-diphosphate reductase beta chain